ncbi:hypothetical protein ABK040_011929 [Willaertia magna]
MSKRKLLRAFETRKQDDNTLELPFSIQGMDHLFKNNNTKTTSASFITPMDSNSLKKKKTNNNNNFVERGKNYQIIKEQQEKEHLEELEFKKEEETLWNEKQLEKELKETDSSTNFKTEANFVRYNTKRKYRRGRKPYGRGGRRKGTFDYKKNEEEEQEEEQSVKEEQEEENDEEMLIDEEENVNNNGISLDYTIEDIVNSKEIAQEVLGKYFKYKEFRKGQFETIQRILRKQSTLLISGTGSGKSLCYQFPTFLLSTVNCQKKEFVIVVSPLISLMEDQRKNLMNGISGALLTNHQTHQQRSKILQDVRKGLIKILFISPERLCDIKFIEYAKQLPPISFVCIDEAHCMSEWSHNFRPSYLNIRKVLETELNVKTILALTGTATKRTEESICDYLNIDKSEGVIRDSLSRSNLIKTVSIGQPSKFTAVLNLLQSERMKDCLDSIIIYTTFRKDAEQLASHLLLNGITAIPYHAGLDSNQRKKIQTQFVNKEISIIIATVAFGMGINISSVKSVIHFNLPRSVESYIQEIGRAGRDGEESQCHIFFDEDDYITSRCLCYSNYVDIFTVKKFLQKILQEESNKISVLGIKQLEKLLDLKSEVIFTLLNIIHQKGYIKLLPNTTHIFTIQFLKSVPSELSKKYNWIKEALKKQTKTSNLVIDLPKIAKECNHSFLELENEITGLKEIGEIKFERKSEAFCLELLTDEENNNKLISKNVIELSQELSNEMKLLESINIKKLDAMYYLAKQYIISDEQAMRKRTVISKLLGKTMEERINEYFTCADEESFCKTLESYKERNNEVVKIELIGKDKTLIEADCFILLKKLEGIQNAKTLTKILCGINSPNITFDLYKTCGMWGRYKHIDFYSLLDIAKDVFLKVQSED